MSSNNIKLPTPEQLAKFICDNTDIDYIYVYEDNDYTDVALDGTVDMVKLSTQILKYIQATNMKESRE